MKIYNYYFLWTRIFRPVNFPFLLLRRSLLKFGNGLFSFISIPKLSWTAIIWQHFDLAFTGEWDKAYHLHFKHWKLYTVERELLFYFTISQLALTNWESVKLSLFFELNIFLHQMTRMISLKRVVDAEIKYHLIFVSW